MKSTRGARNRRVGAFCGVALVVATSGCSSLLAHRGVANVREIDQPETRAAVRAAFGRADETGTCPDGRPVERRWIRQEVPEVWGDVLAGAGRSTDIRDPLLVLVYSPLIELVAIPIQAYRSEQAKLHYAFVYGADARVLYRYNVAASPSDRFRGAVSALTDSLSLPLKENGCPSWAGCLSAFGAEVRQRAACVGYPLTPADEETLHLMQALATDVDAGRIAPDDTLAEFAWCLRSTPWSCLRP